MVCKHCGKEFVSFLSTVCPFCGYDNDVSIFDAIFSPTSNDYPPKKEQSPFNPYDWDDPDNCSDREYMDDEDYDDFDN